MQSLKYMISQLGPSYVSPPRLPPSDVPPPRILGDLGLSSISACVRRAAPSLPSQLSDVPLRYFSTALTGVRGCFVGCLSGYLRDRFFPCFPPSLLDFPLSISGTGGALPAVRAARGMRASLRIYDCNLHRSRS